MRFLQNGPRIPDELLEQRDLGNVVFFCGAGVSIPAGLPSFGRLTRSVMALLGTPPESRAQKLLKKADTLPEFEPPLDEVFNLLQQEYKRYEIEDTVNRILTTPRKPNIGPHQTISRLSRNAAKRAQIVTTNFDLLFERTDRTLPVHVSPTLPDLQSVGSFEGLVYLHGRRTQKPSSRSTAGLILSSSDFGRAYLADGWATRFVRDLLSTYVIVLVGYSATDPPIRYLLEGLHSRGDERRGRIYAFDRGADDEVHDRWRARGVIALPYAGTASDHSMLWNTLDAWAERADDPDRWRRSIITLAQHSPRGLKPCERGQVVSLVRTAEGAGLFAAATPPPAAEWLCVFDRRLRRAAPERGIEEDEFDPLVLYGLDDDTPRPEKNDDEETSSVGERRDDDLIALCPSDERMDRFKRLAGTWRRANDRLPPRLSHLARWLLRILDDPLTAWWAVGYGSLHGELLENLEDRLEHTADLRSFSVRIWRLLIERYRFTPEGSHDDRWYRFAPRLNHEGWTTPVQREFRRLVQPTVVAKRPWRRASRPPTVPFDTPELRAVVDFSIEFPAHQGASLAVPSPILPEVFGILRQALQQGAELLAEIETSYWHTATFHPAQDDADRILNETDQFFGWVRMLFDRLVDEHLDVARGELARWPNDEPYFFDKLKIYAWMKPHVASARAAAVGLLGLTDDGFWNEFHRRELLHTLRARWTAIPSRLRTRLEQRILTGRQQLKGETHEDFVASTSRAAVTILGWLELHGCTISRRTASRRDRLRQDLSKWDGSWDRVADHGHETSARWVQTQSDPSLLLSAPLAKVLELAEKNTRESFHDHTQHVPFQGLVQHHPQRAVLVLSRAAKHGKYPLHFWRTVLASWPAETTDRVLLVCARTLTQLPTDLLRDLRHEASGWLRDRAFKLVKLSPACALSLFDRIVDSVTDEQRADTPSALGDVRLGGKVIQRSRRTYSHAINSPIGHLTQALFRILDALSVLPGAGLPMTIQGRLERVLQAPGEGADHAVSVTAVHLQWLHGIDPTWTERQVLPLFGATQAFAEPAWNGLLHKNVVSERIFRLLKPHFLNIFDIATSWHWENPTAFDGLAQWLIVACYRQADGAPYVSFTEARVALRKMDDRGRAHAVWMLGQAVEETKSWRSFGRAFLTEAWPRETRYRTAAVSSQLAFLAERADEDFPDVVERILALLTPVDQVDVMIHRAIDADHGKPIAIRFPESFLALLDALIAPQPKYVPYELASALASIAEVTPALRDDQRWRRLNSISNRR